MTLTQEQIQAQAMAQATLTPEQIAQTANVPVNNYITPTGAVNITPNIQPPSITPSSLTTVNPTPFVTANNTPTYPVNSLQTPDTTLTATPDATVNDLTSQQQREHTLISDVINQHNSLVNRPADQTAANTQYGVDTAQSSITDLTARLTGLKNEALAIPLQLPTGGMTTSGFNLQVNANLRENAIAALNISTLLSASQGQLTNAQALADKAVAQKYDPINAQIAADEANLNLIKNDPLTTLQDQKRADARQAQLDTQKQQTNLAISNASDVQKIAISAATNQTTFKPTAQYQTATQALQAIQAATDPVVATQIATETGLVTPATSQNEVIDVGGNKMLIDKVTGKIVRSYGGGTPVDNTGSIPVVRTVATPDGKTTPVSGYALVAGDDPYTIAQNNGIDMATLQKLNPTITDWTKLPVGAVINLPDTSNAWLNGKTDAQIQAFNSIPDTNKASVQELVTGNALLADLVKSRGLQGTVAINQLISQATAIDPTFSVNTNKIRYAFMQKWQSPESVVGKTKLAINTALGHLAEVKQM